MDPVRLSTTDLISVPPPTNHFHSPQPMLIKFHYGLFSFLHLRVLHCHQGSLLWCLSLGDTCCEKDLVSCKS